MRGVPSTPRSIPELALLSCGTERTRSWCVWPPGLRTPGDPGAGPPPHSGDPLTGRRAAPPLPQSLPGPGWFRDTPRLTRAPLPRSRPFKEGSEAHLALGGSPWLPGPCGPAALAAHGPPTPDPNSWSWTVSSRTTRVASAETTTACRPTQSSSRRVRTPPRASVGGCGQAPGAPG